MAKIVGPPPIANLDGIIDLLTNPEKYGKYLQDLKELHDNIKSQCGIYDTKEQVDTALRQAENTLNDAQEQARRIAQDQAAAKEKFQNEQLEALRALSARTETLDQREQSLREIGQKQSDKERALLEWEQGVADRIKKQDARDEQLRVRGLELDKQEERIKKANETLKSLGM